MDPGRFDALTRSLAAPTTRRGLLGSLAALGAGLLGARAAEAQQVTQAQCGNVVCNGNGCACTAGCVCCVYGNGNSRCRPPGACGSGTQVACPPPTTTQGPTTTTTTTTPTPTTVPPATTTTSVPTTTTTTTALPYCGGEGENCELPGADCCTAQTGRQCLFAGSGVDVCHDPAFPIHEGGACNDVTFVCGAGLFCDPADGRCAPCAGEGSNCEVGGAASCCAAQTGRQCLDPGSGPATCHDPALPVHEGGACDGINFVCDSGLFCDETVGRCAAAT